jgi:ribosomal protein S6
MHYELTYIVSAQVPETEHGALQAEVLDLLKKAKTTIKLEPYSLGRRRLAYPIEKQRHGFYTVLEFAFEEAEDKAGLKDFETILRHNKNILRHLVVKTNGKPKLEIKNTEAEPEVKAHKTHSSSRVTKKVEKEMPVKSEEKIKVDLTELDQQLDKILEKDQ